jgi:hypothetical protein
MTALLIAALPPGVSAAQIGDPVLYTPPEHPDQSILCVVVGRTQYVSPYDLAHSPATYNLRSVRPKRVINGRFIHAEFTGVSEASLLPKREAQ